MSHVGHVLLISVFTLLYFLFTFTHWNKGECRKCLSKDHCFGRPVTGAVQTWTQGSMYWEAREETTEEVVDPVGRGDCL